MIFCLLRSRPQRSTLGSSSAESEVCKEQVWLVGWEQAEGDVRELCFAIPLEISIKTENPMEEDAMTFLMREVDRYN